MDIVMLREHLSQPKPEFGLARLCALKCLVPRKHEGEQSYRDTYDNSDICQVGECHSQTPPLEEKIELTMKVSLTSVPFLSQSFASGQSEDKEAAGTS